MDRYDYDNMMSEIRLLELKSKRLILEMNCLQDIKPNILRFNKRKKWLNRYNKVMSEQENLENIIKLAYINFDEKFINKIK